MASAPPRRNLPPQAEAWGRWIESQLMSASGTASRAAKAAQNAQSGVTGAIQSSGQGITQIQEVVIPTAFLALEDQIVEASTALDTKILDTKEELENDIQVAVQGAGGNWNYYSSTTPTPQPGGFKVGDLWFDTLDGNRIRRWNGTDWVVTAFGGAALANGSVGDDQLTGFNASKITTGFLATARLAAASISADKVLIGAGTNLVPDPNFLNAAGWSVPGYVTAAGGRLNGGSLLVPASTTQLGAYMGPAPEFAIPVQEGQSLRVGAYYNSAIDVADANRIAVFVRFLSPSGTWSSPTTVVQNAGTATANSWNRLSGNVTIPANVTHMAVGLFKQAAHNGSVRFSDPAVQLRSTGELIVDGAIDGQTITGALVQTVATANRGVKLDAAGLRAFNASGVQTVFIDSTTGEATVTGGLRTSLTGARVLVDTDPDTGRGRIAIVSAANVITGRIDLETGGSMRFAGNSASHNYEGGMTFIGNPRPHENGLPVPDYYVTSTFLNVRFGANTRFNMASGSWQTFDGRNGSNWYSQYRDTVPVNSGWYVAPGFPAPTVNFDAGQRNKVTLTGTMLRRSSPLNVSGAVPYSVMYIPDWYRPNTTQVVMGTHAINGNFFAGHWYINTDGNVEFVSFGSGTIPQDSAGGFAAPGTVSWYRT